MYCRRWASKTASLRDTPFPAEFSIPMVRIIGLFIALWDLLLNSYRMIYIYTVSGRAKSGDA